MMNNFRASGPWIRKKQGKDAATLYNYNVSTSEISVETTPPNLVEKYASTDEPEVCNKMVDAVLQPDGLRLDNLQFGITDGSGRRLRVVVSNEFESDSSNSKIKTIEFIKDATHDENTKKTVLKADSLNYFSKQTEYSEKGVTTINLVDNPNLEQESFSGCINVNFIKDLDEQVSYL